MDDWLRIDREFFFCLLLASSVTFVVLGWRWWLCSFLWTTAIVVKMKKASHS